MKRRKKRIRGWKRLLAWVLGVYVLGSALGTAVIQFSLFGRYMPVRTAAEIPDGGAVSFRSGGNLLAGCLYDAPEENGLIIMLHGFHSGAADCAATAAEFRNAGWDVLVFDGTGTGASEGTGVRGLQQMVLDGAAAIDWAAETRGEEPVFLWGYSMGGYAAAVLAGERPEVQGAAVISAFESPIEMMLAKAREKAGFLAELERPFLLLSEWLLFGSYADKHASEELTDGEPPVLVIQGGADTMVPEGLSLYRRMSGGAGENVILLPEADHMGAVFPADTETVSRFFLDCTGK